MNKKAFLLGVKTVSWIIGILCLIILVGIGIKIYNSASSSKQELKKAELNLERIQNYIEIVEKNPGVEKEFFIESISDKIEWSISAWPFNGNVPNECLEKFVYENCLCICLKPSMTITNWIKNWKDYLSECNEKSKCIKANEKISTFDKTSDTLPITIEKKGVTSLKIYNQKSTGIVLEKI